MQGMRREMAVQVYQAILIGNAAEEGAGFIASDSQPVAQIESRILDDIQLSRPLFIPLADDIHLVGACGPGLAGDLMKRKTRDLVNPWADLPGQASMARSRVPARV